GQLHGRHHEGGGAGQVVDLRRRGNRLDRRNSAGARRFIHHRCNRRHGMETELKLAVDGAALPGLKKALQQMAGGRQIKAKLLTTYYDTPDLLLRRHDMSLRVRRQRGALIQTIKAGTDDMLVREEWEDPVAGPEPDPDAPNAVGKLPDEIAGEEL